MSFPRFIGGFIAIGFGLAMAVFATIEMLFLGEHTKVHHESFHNGNVWSMFILGILIFGVGLWLLIDGILRANRGQRESHPAQPRGVIIGDLFGIPAIGPITVPFPFPPIDLLTARLVLMDELLERERRRREKAEQKAADAEQEAKDAIEKLEKASPSSSAS